MENTSLMTMIEDSSFIVDLLGERQTSYCSIIAKTEKDKALLFNATNNPEKRIGDCVNLEISVKDVFVEVVTCTNERTGETKQCPRIVLIDEKGVGYTAVSLGLFSAVKKLFSLYGEPTWEKPIKIKVQQLTKGEKKILTFNVV